MRFAIAVLLFASAAAGAANAGCAGDALERATLLLKLHFAEGGEVANLAISDVVRTLPPIKALVGKGKFDVLEVRGYVYKAEYRMRFIYAQVPGECLLMGQEIIEVSDPY